MKRITKREYFMLKKRGSKSLARTKKNFWLINVH